MILSHARIWLIAGMSTLTPLTTHAQTTPTPTAPAPVTGGITPPATPAVLLRPGQVPGNYKTYLNQRYADDKEARATIQLFRRKSTGGVLWLVSGAAFIGFVTSQTGTTTSSSGTTTVKVSPLGYGLLLGLFGGVGIGKLARFSNEKLYQVLADHEKQSGFPAYVAKRLRDRDYR